MTRLEIGFITEADYEAEEHEEHAIIRSTGVDKYSFLYSVPHSDGGTYIKTAEYNKEQLMVWFRGTLRMARMALNPYKAFQFWFPIVPECIIPIEKLTDDDEFYSLVDLFSHQLDFLNVEGPPVVAAVVQAVAAVVQEDPISSSSSSSQDDPVSDASVPVVESPSVSVVPVVSSPSGSDTSIPSVPVVESPSVSETSVPVVESPSVSVVPVVESPSASVSEERMVPGPRRSLRLKRLDRAANEQELNR